MIGGWRDATGVLNGFAQGAQGNLSPFGEALSPRGLGCRRSVTFGKFRVCPKAAAALTIRAIPIETPHP
jgi:hypothetical protein